MHDLKEKMTYYYRVGDGSSSVNAWSDMLSFTTTAHDAESTTYAVIADMAYDTMSDGTVASVQKLVQAGTIQVCNITYYSFFHEQL
jgi:hypothetical protein